MGSHTEIQARNMPNHAHIHFHNAHAHSQRETGADADTDMCPMMSSLVAVVIPLCYLYDLSGQTLRASMLFTHIVMIGPSCRCMPFVPAVPVLARRNANADMQNQAQMQAHGHKYSSIYFREKHASRVCELQLLLCYVIRLHKHLLPQ